MTSGEAGAPLRVVIADDQASVREGLVLLLGGLPGIEVVGAAADGEQALALVTEHKPDAILLDLHMPVLDGIGATRRLVAEHPEVAIVVLTTFADDSTVLDALHAGARLRVVIADDQASVREGLVLLLGGLPGIEVVGAAADGEQALALVAERKPDAILLDLHMPVLDGIGATRRLVAEHPEVAIVVLTTFADDSTVLDALHAGARSYLTKDADHTEIAKALQAAAGGLTVFDPRVHATLLAATAARAKPEAAAAPPPDGLTDREAEILGLIARGMTNPEIAAELFLSNHTIKTHISRIFAKTGSRDRAAAIGYAHRHNIG